MLLLRGSAAGVALAASFLDSGDKTSTITLTNSNLTATKDATTGNAYAFGAHGKESGKWRFQVTVDNFGGADLTIGLTCGLFNGRSFYLGQTTEGIGLNNGASGVITNAATQYGANTGLPTGTVIDVYADVDAGRVWFAKNGVVLSGDPVAGTGGTLMTAAMLKAWYPTVYLHGANNAVTFNFGASAFTYAGASAYSPWSANASNMFLSFRSAAIFIRSLGNFSHGIAEMELEATSNGANVLAGATVTSSLALTGGALASTIDANTTTFGSVGNTGSANQANGYFAFELAANAARNVAFAAVRGRDGGAANAAQAPTLFDLWTSTGTVAAGPWYRAKTGVTLTAFAATTPGERKEFAVP